MPLDALNLSDNPANYNDVRSAEPSAGWFAKIPMAVVGDKRLSHARLRVLVALAGFADKEGCCWPSKRRIANAPAVAEPTVLAHIHGLGTLGYVRKIPQKRANGADGANRYHLDFGAARGSWAARGGEAEQPGEGKLSSPGRGS